MEVIKVTAHDMKMYKRMEEWLHSFLTSALDLEYSTLRPGGFTPRKEPRYVLNWLGGLQSGLDLLEKRNFF
jgi:hypothetical protein